MVAKNGSKRSFFKRGNSKLGKDTLVFNFTSATDCMSKKLGLCKCASKCYAMKAEIQYHHVVLPYRNWQTEYFDSHSAEELATEIRGYLGRRFKEPIEYVRFSEAGDFRDQSDVNKLFAIAWNVPELVFYGYTARKDLDFSDAPENVVVNGSGFMIHNNFEAVPKESVTKKAHLCHGDCKNCDLCKVRSGNYVQIIFH